jgi:uncharacterized protein (TIGR02118 family)
VLKVTFVVYEKAGLDRAQALRYWRDIHGPMDAKIPGLQRYVQQHAVAAPEGDSPFLGVATTTFADAQRLPTAFVEEVVIVG